MSLIWKAAIPAVLVGISMLVRRFVANLTQLNDDLVPGVSPNDLLCLIVACIILGCYFGFRGQADPIRWDAFEPRLP